MPEETEDSESTEGFSVHERRVPLALGQRDTRAGETILGETLTARPRAQGPERKARDARGRGPSGTEREALSVSEPGRPLGRGRCARAAEPCCKREPGLQPVPPEPRASGLGWVGAQRLTHCVRGHRRCSQGGGGDVGCCGRAASSRGRGWGEVTHLEVSPPSLRDSPRCLPAPRRGTLPAPCPPSPPASRTARAPAFASVLPLLAHVCPPPMPIFLLGFWCVRINFRSLCMLRKLSLCRGLCYEQVLFPVRSFLV